MTSDNAGNTAAAILAFFLSFLSVFLNSILIFIIVRTTILHTNTNFFLLSLSAGELLVAVFSTPFAGLAKMSCPYASSETFCRFSGFCNCLGNTAAFLSLLMVSIDRCIAITRPLKYSSVIGKCAVTSMISYAWLHGLILSSILFTGNSGGYTLAPKYSLCLALRKSYVTGFFGSFLPAIAILCTVVKIIKEAKSHHRIFAVIVGSNFYDGLYKRSNVSYGRTTMKALRALLVIIGGYALFRVPLYIVAIVDETHGNSLSQEVVTSFVWLSFLCGIINPAVIILFNKTFKQKFVQTVGFLCIRLLGKRKKDCFSISSGLHSMLDATLVINKMQNHSIARPRISMERMTGHSQQCIQIDHRQLTINRSSSSPSFA